MIITLELGCQLVCLLDRGHEGWSNLIEVKHWTGGESGSWTWVASEFQDCIPLPSPKLLCGTLWVQPGLIPGESVAMGMYLNTVACFPTSMFSCCPHFESEFIVWALVHLLSPGWRKDLSILQHMETSSGPYFGALQELDIHQDKSGPSWAICIHVVRGPGGCQVESWHLWTFSCSQMVLSEVKRLCPGEIFK